MEENRGDCTKQIFKGSTFNTDINATDELWTYCPSGRFWDMIDIRGVADGFSLCEGGAKSLDRIIHEDRCETPKANRRNCSAGDVFSMQEFVSRFPGHRKKLSSIEKKCAKAPGNTKGQWPEFTGRLSLRKRGWRKAFLQTVLYRKSWVVKAETNCRTIPVRSFHIYPCVLCYVGVNTHQKGFNPPVPYCSR